MVVGLDRLPVELLAEAAVRIAAATDLQPALAELARAASAATGADLAVVRIRDPDGELVVRGVAPEGSTLAAELTGARTPAEWATTGVASDAVARISERAYAADVIVLPARAGARVVGSLELLRFVEQFDEADRAAATLLAAQLALIVRTLAPGLASAARERRSRVLELTGDALAAGSDVHRAARQALRAAVEATRARGGAVWRVGGDRPELVASEGSVQTELDRAGRLVADLIAAARRPVAVERDRLLAENADPTIVLPLGEPAFGALQLFYREDSLPAESELRALAGFAARMAHALRSGEQAADTALELGRARTLLEVVGEATSRLSLAHTLETGVDRLAQVLELDEVGVYLNEAGTLRSAAGHALAPGHEQVATRLLDAAQGPLRARPFLHATVGGREPGLAGVRASLRAAGRASVAAVPLRVPGETIGLLVVYPGRRRLSEGDGALLSALAAQLAVAAQNARLHEQATELGRALGEALQAERQASRQIAALYEISRSFAQTLSLDATLQAVTESVVRELEVDAAVIRVPDERGDVLVPRAVHVQQSHLAAAVSSILDLPQRRSALAAEAQLLDLRQLGRLGGAYALLRPFVEQGSTVALLPIATASDVLAELTILSLDPAAPIGADTLATGRTIARQAALAIDNARLYQQQKRFAETMQHSLLPADEPAVPGLEVGRVYEPAAQLDVGGDVYDFLELPDGRLAVILGDVTGHGIEATAAMAMAKFVFRSLAREHSEPGEFLAHANEVIVGEIAAGKFITMAYLTIDGEGRVVYAAAGHPRPRLVRAGGAVEPVECGGLALGIEAEQRYREVRRGLAVGDAVVLYTDGVVESRSGGELFGEERLDELLRSTAGLPAQSMADAVLAAAREFAGRNLPDDCAVIVIRRTEA